MTFVNGEVQARFMARIRGVDPQRCLAIPVDVGKATVVALVADRYGEIIVGPFEFALTEAGFAVLSAAITRAQVERDALIVRTTKDPGGPADHSAGDNPRPNAKDHTDPDNEPSQTHSWKIEA